MAEQEAKLNELAYVRLRFKQPQGDKSSLTERVIKRSDIVELNQASPELRFASAVAALGQQLRGGEYLGDFCLPRHTRPGLHGPAQMTLSVTGASLSPSLIWLPA